MIVVLIAFCGYNWLQVRSLQAQVADLQSRQAARERRVETRPEAPALPVLLQQANKHAGLARTALARSDWKTAQRELQQGITDMTEASHSQDARRDLAALQAQTRQLQEEADDLWHKASSQAGRISH